MEKLSKDLEYLIKMISYESFVSGYHFGINNASKSDDYYSFFPYSDKLIETVNNSIKKFKDNYHE